MGTVWWVQSSPTSVHSNEQHVWCDECVSTHTWSCFVLVPKFVVPTTDSRSFFIAHDLIDPNPSRMLLLSCARITSTDWQRIQEVLIRKCSKARRVTCARLEANTSIEEHLFPRSMLPPAAISSCRVEFLSRATKAVVRLPCTFNGVAVYNGVAAPWWGPFRWSSVVAVILRSNAVTVCLVVMTS